MVSRSMSESCSPIASFMMFLRFALTSLPMVLTLTSMLLSFSIRVFNVER